MRDDTKENKRNNRKLTRLAFHEMSENTPTRVARTLRESGKKAAQRQLKAIALDRARDLGAKVR